MPTTTVNEKQLYPIEGTLPAFPPTNSPEVPIFQAFPAIQTGENIPGIILSLNSPYGKKTERDFFIPNQNITAIEPNGNGDYFSQSSSLTVHPSRNYADYPTPFKDAFVSGIREAHL